VIRQLASYLRTIPEEERGRRVVLAAARALMAAGGDGDAQKLIETALERGDGD
jgi:HemY protein